MRQPAFKGLLDLSLVLWVWMLQNFRRLFPRLFIAALTRVFRKAIVLVPNGSLFLRLFLMLAVASIGVVHLAGRVACIGSRQALALITRLDSGGRTVVPLWIYDMMNSIFACGIAIHEGHIEFAQRIDCHELPLVGLHLTHDLVLLVLVDELVRLVARAVVRGVLRLFATLKPTFHQMVVVRLLLIDFIDNLRQVAIESLSRLLWLALDRRLGVLLLN